MLQKVQVVTWTQHTSHSSVSVSFFPPNRRCQHLWWKPLRVLRSNYFLAKHPGQWSFVPQSLFPKTDFDQVCCQYHLPVRPSTPIITCFSKFAINCGEYQLCHFLPKPYWNISWKASCRTDSGQNWKVSSFWKVLLLVRQQRQIAIFCQKSMFLLGKGWPLDRWASCQNNMFLLVFFWYVQKHCKNCEYCPVSLLIVR